MFAIVRSSVSDSLPVDNSRYESTLELRRWPAIAETDGRLPRTRRSDASQMPQLDADQSHEDLCATCVWSPWPG